MSVEVETPKAPPASGERGPEALRRPPLWRRFLVALLLILGFLLTPVAVLVTYAKTQVLDTDRYVATVRPLATDPAVQSYVAKTVSDNILAQIDVRQYVTEALPPQSQALAGPITSAVQGFVQQATQRVVESDLFARVWVEANRVAHAQIVRVLTGERAAVTVSENGAVTVDLKEVASTVKQQLSDAGLTVVDKVPLDRVSGSIKIFQSEELYKARRAASLLDNVGYALPFIVMGCFGGAILLSQRRRRAFIKAAFAFAAGAVLLALLVNLAREAYLDAVGSALPHDTAAAFYDTMLRSLNTSVRNILLVGIVIALAAFVAGPARPATAFRAWWARAVTWAGADADRGGWGVLSSSAWMSRNKRLLRIILAVVLFLVAFRWPHPTTAVLLWLVLVSLAGLVVIDFYGRRPAAVPER